jgi:hypothetical protein
MAKQKKYSSTQGGWPITIERFVVYVDIMGFKDMVARSTHNQVYQLMKKIDKNIKRIDNIKWKGEADVRTANYSDSIMIYSKDSTKKSIDSIIAVTSVLIDELLVQKIPCKGALAFGNMTLDFNNSIFFGQPLIDAYLLQEELHFYGIIAHATFESKLHEMKLMDDDSLSPYIKEYLCPLKQGASNHLTVLPFCPALNAVSEGLFKIRVKKTFASVRKLRYGTSGHLRKYIDNTEMYLKTITG